MKTDEELIEWCGDWVPNAMSRDSLRDGLRRELELRKRESIRNDMNFAVFQDEFCIAMEALDAIATHSEGSHPVIAGVALAKIRRPKPSPFRLEPES